MQRIAEPGRVIGVPGPIGGIRRLAPRDPCPGDVGDVGNLRLVQSEPCALPLSNAFTIGSSILE